MNTVTLEAKAKINLFLEITGKRENGYHNISTLMHSIDLCDNVYLRLNTNKEITITSNSTSMPCDSRNIAYRCAEYFFEQSEIKNSGLNIHIEKNIPMEAGLGGGSADGAAVLNGLNILYGNIFTKDKLCEIGKRAGADIPFCIMGGSMLAEGIGEILTPCKILPECYILIAKGKTGVSTKEAYSALDSMQNRRIYSNTMPMLLEKGGLSEICNGFYNCFELLLPEAEKIKSIMKSYGALNALMSGSGSAVFGIFTEKKDAEKALDGFKQKNIFSSICHNKSANAEPIIEHGKGFSIHQ